MMALYGLFFYGPASHLWYTRLDSHIPGATLTIVFKKLMFDEMIGSPIFFFLFFAGLCNIFQPVLSVQIKFVYMTVYIVFCAGTGLFEGKSWEQIEDEMEHKFLRLYEVSNNRIC